MSNHSGKSRPAAGLARKGLFNLGLTLVLAWSFFACEVSGPSSNDQTTDGSGGSASGGADLVGDGLAGGPPSGGASQELQRTVQGTGCVARNDCSDGQSCVRGKCQPVDFDLEPTGKECVRVDCETTEDCCAGKGSELPEKCLSKAARCTATLPGCSETECSRSSDCGGGGTCVGSCAITQGECRAGADCVENFCDDGACTIDFSPCTSDAECSENTCVGGQCACENAAFEPADPVCTDPDCEDLCQWACEEQRCVLPSSCKSNDSCFGTTALCDEGQCVECRNSNDCTFGRICIEGRCETPCTSDLNCPLFEACEAGECIYVGCRSDRECSLLPSLAEAGISELDQRLLRCATTLGVGECILPCTSDAQCPPTEVCSGGMCKYIGCETAAECKAILNARDETIDPETPWVTHLKCQSPD